MATIPRKVCKVCCSNQRIELFSIRPDGAIYKSCDTCRHRRANSVLLGRADRIIGMINELDGQHLQHVIDAIDVIKAKQTQTPPNTPTNDSPALPAAIAATS
jgi:hypothetical protein